MTAIPKTERISPEDYLAAERAAESKSEFAGGEVFAMSGASLAHNRIATSLHRELGTQLKGRPCDLFNSDMKVWLEPAKTFAYPDASALGGEIETYDEKNDIVTNPSFIAEILSDSTETYDRGNKFKAYATLPSLSEYLLISQHEMEVETRIRQDDNSWLLETFTAPDTIVALPSIGCELRLADLYDKVEFDQSA